MANLVSTKDSLLIGSDCLTEIPPTPRLESRFVSAVQHIPVASKRLAKVWCLIVLAGSAYLCCKIYQYFCNKTSSNQHLQDSEWIELNNDVIIEVVEESRLENNLPHNDALREEHPRIMKIARILVRTSMAGSQLNKDQPQQDLQGLQLMDIKDDIFSLIRAVVLQNLMCKISLLERVGGARCLVQKFEIWENGRQDWLKNWKFHDAESSSFSCFFHICFTCLGTLHKLEEDINIERKSCLTLACADRVNPTVSKLLEAVKLIMMASAIELFEQQTNLDAVPTFSALLFSRAATRNPRSLMLNHFNLLGHTEECLEEIDYYLLGYSLRETITIIRPHLHGTKDFIKRYPECMIGFWPEIMVFVDPEGRCSIRGN